MIDRCEAQTGPVWSIANDPRVTKIGRWLRDTHLDELPQLINVLRGEMALVGPRPERPELAANIERVMPEFRNRLLVKPGITGLAQLRPLGHMNMEIVRQKLSDDLDYIRDLSPALDMKICLWTIAYVLRRLVEMMRARTRQSWDRINAADLPVDLTYLGDPDRTAASENVRIPDSTIRTGTMLVSKAA